MQDAAFIKAAEPKPHRVLGLELLPFSIGHCILLQRHDSVFASPNGGPVGIDDLLLATLICSQSYKEAKKSFRSRWLNLFVRFWGWRCRKLNILEEARSLRSYMDELGNTPEVVMDLNPDGTPKGSASAGGTPWINKLRVFLMSELHVSADRVMDYPLALAQWDFWTHQALQGNDAMAGDAIMEACGRGNMEEMN